MYDSTSTFGFPPEVSSRRGKAPRDKKIVEIPPIKMVNNFYDYGK